MYLEESKIRHEKEQEILTIRKEIEMVQVAKKVKKKEINIGQAIPTNDIMLLKQQQELQQKNNILDEENQTEILIKTLQNQIMGLKEAIMDLQFKLDEHKVMVIKGKKKNLELEKDN